jgi:hypothetical protein
MKSRLDIGISLAALTVLDIRPGNIFADCPSCVSVGALLARVFFDCCQKLSFDSKRIKTSMNRPVKKTTVVFEPISVPVRR